MSDSPTFLSSYINLRFFNRVRRLLCPKNSNKRNNRTSFDTSSLRPITKIMVMKESINDHHGWLGLRMAVKKLHFGSWEEKEVAAVEIGRFSAKEDVKMRKLIGGLGVIPVLVAMAASEVADRRRVAVVALVQLANGTYTNKALMVEAGILSKLPKDIKTLDDSTMHQYAQLLVLLSSLANTPFPLPSLEIAPFLLAILASNTSNLETKHSCLGALHNLSTMLDNAGDLVSNGAVDTLLKMSSNKSLSEKSLVTLGNLVVTLKGKKAMETSPLEPQSLIEILTWDEKPKCQEISCYILMILAHHSSDQRSKMARAGIVHVLLEVALLGSSLAQKRALKLLQWFKDEKQAKMGPHSGPQTARLAFRSPVNNPETARQGKKMMRNLVRQSLNKNMEMITRRASASGDSSNIKALTISTSSKSFHY